jgi:hypothetical protein
MLFDYIKLLKKIDRLHFCDAVLFDVSDNLQILNKILSYPSTSAYLNDHHHIYAMFNIFIVNIIIFMLETIRLIYHLEQQYLEINMNEMEKYIMNKIVN